MISRHKYPTTKRSNHLNKGMLGRLLLDFHRDMRNVFQLFSTVSGNSHEVRHPADWDTWSSLGQIAIGLPKRGM